MASDGLPLTALLRQKSRSAGTKLLFVFGLALLMSIPAFYVDSIVEDRTKRATAVVEEIGGRAGGQQIFLGPTLAIPYAVPLAYKNATPTTGIYVVFPVKGDAETVLRIEERHRSLFKVPVYEADLKFTASFDVPSALDALPAGAQLDWTNASIVVGASDARGALADSTVSINGSTATVIPAERLSTDTQEFQLTYFRVRAGLAAHPGASFNVAANMAFSGAQRIAVLAYGKSTHVSISGNWPNPSFDGGFLPAQQTISPQGFRAEWSVPYIARGVPAEGNTMIANALAHTALGVSLVEVADPYQSVSRSVKYALLFIGLLFLSYFVFEVTAGKRVHPAQYLLVGMAHLIFYLLLLALAERIGFDSAFLAAGGATVALLAANAGWIFASRLQGFRALTVFTLLYGFIYLLLRLEDNALLVGAVASFLAVAAVMFFTRNLNWYSSLQGTSVTSDNGSNIVK